MKSVLLLGVLILFYPSITHAAWVATENFDSYSTGAIAGDNGGTGWSGAWSTAVAGWSVNNTTSLSSPNSVENSTLNAASSRTMSAGVTDGIAAVGVESSDYTNTMHSYFHLQHSTTIVASINVGGGSLQFCSDVATTCESPVASPSAGTWYLIEVQIDQVNSRMRSRLSTATTWGAWITTSAFTNIDTIRINNDSSGTHTGIVRFDSIGPGTDVPAAKTIIGILQPLWI